MCTLVEREQVAGSIVAHLPSVRSDAFQFGSGSRSRHCTKVMYMYIHVECYNNVYNLPIHVVHCVDIY